jgi:hypothetical protein
LTAFRQKELARKRQILDILIIRVADGGEPLAKLAQLIEQLRRSRSGD